MCNWSYYLCSGDYIHICVYVCAQVLVGVCMRVHVYTMYMFLFVQ